MRVFVTGATGFIGSAVVRELIEARHQVTGLARSARAAAALTAAGASVHRGSLEDPASLRGGAAAADGVIHTAYIHDFSENNDATAYARIDRRAIETMGEALAGSGRPLVVTSGLVHTPGRPSTEEDDAPDNPAYPRVSERVALSLVGRGVRACVVRVPIVRLAVAAAPEGARLHGAGEEGVPFRDIASVIGRHLGLPVTALSPGEAQEHFGLFSLFVAMDIPACSALTRKQVGWEPDGPGLIGDLDEGHYFRV
jgi:nucleoside-diphosphate-sugar epimerase